MKTELTQQEREFFSRLNQLKGGNSKTTIVLVTVVVLLLLGYFSMRLMGFVF